MSEPIQWLATALTGAGILAESGVPTFRGEGGLWRNFRPGRKPGLVRAGLGATSSELWPVF